MSNCPPVAVLLPIYRGDCVEHFRQALDSILSQDYPRERIHIYLGIDGQVSDELNRFIASRNDFHKVIRQEANLGLANTLNNLIDSLEDEEFIFRMDADDISLPDRFRIQLDYLEANPEISLCGGQIIEFETDPAHGSCLRRYITDKDYMRRNAKYLICKANPVAHVTVCFRRSFFERIPRYPIEYRRNQDLMLWFESLAAGIQFVNVEQPLVYVRTPSDFFRRRRGKAAWEEFQIYRDGIWKIHGLTWRFAYPIARLLLRMMPGSVIDLVYQGEIRRKATR